MAGYLKYMLYGKAKPKMKGGKYAGWAKSEGRGKKWAKETGPGMEYAKKPVKYKTYAFGRWVKK